LLSATLAIPRIQFRQKPGLVAVYASVIVSAQRAAGFQFDRQHAVPWRANLGSDTRDGTLLSLG
jgi:hypothetical protein